jgi:hypothetical protein
MITRVSLSELIASGLRLRPAEAVAIVGEVCRQRAAGLLPGLPSPSVIRLASHGEITIEGPVPAGEDHVHRAAQLLDALLPGHDAPPEYRASGALRLAIARGLGTLDLPPYPSLEAFCVALLRFTTLDAHDTVASLVAAYHEAGLPSAAETALAVTPVATLSERPHPALYLVWIAAPAAAAALGYVLALPVARLTAPPRVSAVHTAPVAASAPQTAAAAPALPPATEPAPAPPAPAPVAQSAELRTPRMLQASAYSPAFATSGAVYFHQERAGTSALKVAEAGDATRDPKVKTILDDRSRNFHVRPSPDGSLIAFDSDRDGVRGVFVAHADGSGIRRISGDGYAGVPSWSPDGRQLAFVRGEPSSPKVWNLWIAAPDGSDLHRVTHHRVGQAWGGSWFPDGRRIAYSVEDRLVILDLITAKSTVLRSPQPGHLPRTPAVSPDGRRIVFQVQHDGMWVADVETGEMSRVLADPTAEEYAWAPDGHHVAYHSHRSGTWSVWVVPV